MQKQELLKILRDWNEWGKEIPSGYPRDLYTHKLKTYLKSQQICVILGARRAGKSYLMRQLVENLIHQGMPQKNALFINFEDPRFSSLDSQLLQDIFEVYLEYMQPQDIPYLFFDEIQNVTGWEKWVRMMHELHKAHIVISGSNATLLSRELAITLTGRHLDVVVTPLSFREYLTFKNVPIQTTQKNVSTNGEFSQLLAEYMDFGGFPEVVLRQNKQELLLHYFEDILERDLSRRYKIRKIQTTKDILKFYFSNIATPTTFRSIAKNFDISTDSVEKFSGYFQDVYLLQFLKRFSWKSKEQEKSPRKVYASDVGLANTLGFRLSNNAGRIMENIVYLELFRRCLQNASNEIFYWKDQLHHEVDFVVKSNTKVQQLIQVCYDLSNPATKKRELSALIKASDLLHCSNLLLICFEEEGEVMLDGKKNRFYTAE